MHNYRDCNPTNHSSNKTRNEIYAERERVRAREKPPWRGGGTRSSLRGGGRSPWAPYNETCTH